MAGKKHALWAILTSVGLLTLAALAAHAWINARAATDFLNLGVPPFQFRCRAGFLIVTRISPALEGGPSADAMLSGVPDLILAPGDQILRVAGRPVHASDRWQYPVLWRAGGRPLRRGQPLSLTVVRAGIPREVVVRLAAIPAEQAQEIGRIRAMMLPKQIAGFGLWLLSALVLFRRRDPVTRLFFFWCQALALYTAGSIVAAPLWDRYPVLPIQLFRLGFTTGWFLAPPLFGHFCWRYAGRQYALRWQRLLPGLLYVVPLLALLVTRLSILGGAANSPGASAPGWGLRLLWAALAVSWLGALAAGFATLLRAHREAVDALRRKQVARVLLGSSAYGAVFLHAFVTVVARWDTGATGVWAWLPYVLLPVTPIAFADAILRHQLLDLNLVIRRSLVYTLLTVTLAGIFIALQGLAGSALQSMTGATGLPAQTLAALAVAALFTPMERRIARLVERIFNQRQLRRLEQLRLLGEEIDHMEDAARLQRTLVDGLVEGMELGSAALYGSDAGSGVYRRVYQAGKAGCDRVIVFPAEGTLGGRLVNSAAPFEPAQLRCAACQPCPADDQVERLDAMGVALCVPMSVRGVLTGMLLLGSSRHGEPFSATEKEALLALGSLAARALRHAEMAHRLRELERELAALTERRRGVTAGRSGRSATPAD
jgi:hypothetical protein